MSFIETDKYIVREIESGLIENYIKEGVHLLREDVESIKRANIEVSSRDKYVVLVNSKEFTSISREARELSASREFAKETIAKALMAPSTGHKIVSQFYIRVNKPVILTEIFTDIDKALVWLRSFL